MKTVEFKYDINQKVRTKHGDTGFITALEMDQNNVLWYWVECGQKEKDAWRTENEFEPVND